MLKKFISRCLTIQLTAAMLLCPGCKQPNPEGREDVSGTITFNGQTIDPKWEASISFVPSDGRDVTEGGGIQIIQGRYLLTGIGGVKPGRYKVKIQMSRLYDIKTRQPSTPETGDFDSVRVPLIPREFNDGTTLEFEVIQGKKNVFNYDIVTDYVPDIDSVLDRQRNSRPPA